MGLRQKAMSQAKRIACAKARDERKLSVLRIPHRLVWLENRVRDQCCKTTLEKQTLTL